MSGGLPTVGSMCSGYGGLDLGLGLAVGSVDVLWHVENDRWPSAILAHHYPAVPNFGDLTSLDLGSLPRVDWLTAGYPCQPFSHAGKRKGTADERHLWPYVAAAIGVLRPRHVLLENVRGHVSLGLDTVIGDLSSLGYDCRWGVVRAADAGAPHGRARVFIVATDADAAAQRRGWGEGEQRRLGAAGFLPDAAADPGSQRRQWRQGVDAEGRLPSVGGEAGGDARDSSSAAAPAAYAEDNRPQVLRTRGSATSGAWLASGQQLATDTAGDGRHEGRTQPAGLLGGPDAPKRGLPVADPACDTGRLGDGDDVPARWERQDWGVYGPAIRRWERITGALAPRPTEPGRRGQRLSPRFVEWLMGLPEGWVTAVSGMPRNAQLKALGNGVVPQQAALALHLLGVAPNAADRVVQLGYSTDLLAAHILAALLGLPATGWRP